MHRRTRTLSVDDQKAVDVCLDHAAAADKSKMTRMATPVQQKRLSAATKILSLLSELPAIDPPADLVVRTMQHIEKSTSGKIQNLLSDSISGQMIH